MESLRVWVATRRGPSGDQKVIALFNLENQPATVNATWSQLGVTTPPHNIRDLVSGKTLTNAQKLEVMLPPHGSIAYRLD